MCSIPRIEDMEMRRCEQYSQGGAQHWLQLVIRKVGWIMQRATFVLFSSLWCPTLFISLFPWSDIVSIPIVIELKPRNIAFLWLHHTYHNILAHSQNIFHCSPHEGCHPCSEQVWVPLLCLVCNTLGVAKRIRLESSWKASSLFSWWLRHSGEAGLELSYSAWLSSELVSFLTCCKAPAVRTAAKITWTSCFAGTPGSHDSLSNHLPQMF